MSEEIRSRESGAGSQENGGQFYHQAIGEQFISVRGAGFALSPHDLVLIDKWFFDGVPLHIPMNVLSDVAERISRNGGEGRIRSLSYVQEEVEARFAELVERHVGCGGCEKPYCGAGVMAA